MNENAIRMSLFSFLEEMKKGWVLLDSHNARHLGHKLESFFNKEDLSKEVTVERRDEFSFRSNSGLLRKRFWNVLGVNLPTSQIVQKALGLNEKEEQEL